MTTASRPLATALWGARFAGDWLPSCYTTWGDTTERGRSGDPEVSARRRKLSYKMRDTRVKLTSSGSGVGAFNRELLKSFAASRKSGRGQAMATAGSG